MSSQDNTAGRHGSGKTADKVFKGVAYGCGILILVVLAAVALFLLFRAWPLIGGDQKANSATISNFTGGKATNFWQYVGPLLFGTVLVSALALLISFFISVGIALFISHYAPKKLATVLSYVVDLLAAIPSVIYGLWGGLVLVPAIYPFWNWLSKTFGWIPIFAGPAANPSRTVATVSVVLAVMILPIITSMSRDIFLQTPRLQEEAALALGATRWEMVKLAVLPFGKSGVVSASMLGLGRALGETMAVLMILSPGLNYSFKLLQASQNQTIAANIAAQYPEANALGVSALIGTGLVLFLITFNFLSYNMTGVVGGNPTPSGGYGGVQHAIIGTLEITLGAMVISIPIGLMCAVYLVEYSNRGKLSRAITLLVDVMSGIPSIVAGLFAFSMFTILLGPGTINGFEGSVALSLLMLPTVVKSSEEMLKIVPNDLREASYALGVTKQRTITKIVLRTALPGIVSGCILAIARVIGETAPLLMTAGYIASTNVNLFSGQMTTLPVYVYQEYSKLNANCPVGAGASCVTTIPMERAWAAALVLIVLVLILNLIGRLVAKVFAVKTER